MKLRKRHRDILVAVLILVVVAGAAVSADSQPFTVKLQIDKPYCLLNFMETLRTRGYYGPTLYSHFQKSKFSQDETLAKLVEDYTRIKTVYRYQIDGCPKYRFAAKDKSTSDLIFTLSTRAKSLGELKQITLGIIPMDDHLRLFDVLEAAEPFYDELVWKPYYQRAHTRLRALQTYAEEVNLGGMLGPIAHFLDSSWDTDIPLIVSFSIVPGEKIRMVPPPLGNVVRAGLLTESEDYAWYVALIAHEFTHRAFAEQPMARHQQIDRWLTDSKSPHRGTVNLMFDEVLAGAVGHKVREDLSGQAHAFTYNQAAVRAMDEATYPLVISYLEQNKSIDRAFVHHCLDLYDKTFPNALYEYHSLFQVYYLLTDAQEDEARQLPRLMRKNIVGPMMYEVSAGITDEHIEGLQAYEFTKVIVITKDNARTLAQLKGTLGVLCKCETLDPESDWVLTCHDDHRSPYVIINLQSAHGFEAVCKQIKAAKQADSTGAPLYVKR
jgi:hypothetical protein